MTDELRQTVIGLAAVRRVIAIDDIAQRAGCTASQVIDILLPLVEPELAPDGSSAWSLHTDHRRRALAAADRDTAIRWLHGAASDDRVDQVAARWLRGGPLLDDEVHEHPDAVRQVLTWVEDCAWLSFPVAAVRQRLALFELRQRLVARIGTAFTGRERELTLLSSCIVNGLMLAIEARGGMGKSALLARALLDAGAYRDGGPLVAWLDFDNPLVDVREPETIILELARQLALQDPDLQGFEAALRDELDAYRRSARTRDAAVARELTDDRVWFLTSHQLRRLATARRLVIILDTFERSQQLSASLSARFLGDFAPVLREVNACLLVAGRGPLDLEPIFGAATLHLDLLAPEEAVACLRSLELAEPAARQVAAAVRRAPLTLHLAARAVHGLGDAPFPEVELRWAIRRQLVDGFLYSRVLAHLPSIRLGDVARLAILLHSITPEYLIEIVGPLVDPPIRGEREAAALYDELSAVADLVSIPYTGALRLRWEIAAELIALMTDAEPQRVRALHERAVSFLAAKPDRSVLDTTELVIHLLLLDRLSDAARHLDQVRWNDVVGYCPVLSSEAVEWLQPRVTADRNATLEDRVRALLRADRPRDALVALDAAPQRTAGLLALEARAAFATRDHLRVTQTIARARALSSTPDPQLELLALRLQLEGSSGEAQQLSLGRRITLIVALLALFGAYAGSSSDWLAAISALGTAALAIAIWQFEIRRRNRRINQGVSLGSVQELNHELTDHPALQAELALALSRCADDRLVRTGRSTLTILLQDVESWRELCVTDLDIARQLVATLGDVALDRALEDRLFDQPGLRFAPAAELLGAMGAALPSMERGTAETWRDELERLAERGSASMMLDDLLTQLGPDQRSHRGNRWARLEAAPAAHHRFRAALLAVLATPPRARNANRRDRAALLEEVAALVEHQASDDVWRQVVRGVLDIESLERALADVRDPGLRIRRTLTIIDRDGAGPRLAAALETRGATALARVSRRLWPSSGPTVNPGLAL